MQIREYRKRAGMTQAELAARMDVDQSAVSLWEAGKTRPLRKMRERLAKVLGCTVEELLADD